MGKGIPKGMAAIYSKSSIVEVELEKCRDWLSFSYTGDGWHYLSALIKEYIQNPNLTYNESILKAYYKKFQPRTLQEVLFENELFAKPPINKSGIPMPWLKTQLRFGGKFQHYGPNTDKFGIEEFTRTINLFKKISNEGYRPNQYPEGYIRGYFLKKFHDYRFIVSNGHHRMAVLAILGYKNIKVMVDPKLQRVIDIEKVNEWQNIRNGMYPKKIAIEIFNLPFNKNGKEKAKALELYSKIYSQ